MTTAHRPTWHSALGGDDQGGNKLFGTSKIGSKEQPSHKKLKVREFGQGCKDELSQKQFKNELLLKENKILIEKRIKNSDVFPPIDASSQTDQLTLLENEYINPFPEDADDAGNELEDDENENDDEEVAELLRELEKIKRDREEEEAKKRIEKEKEEEEQRRQKILRDNPLLMAESVVGTGGIKKRWDDDVVFKNQAKKVTNKKRTFVNDTVRSEFHKKFLSKYIA